MSKTYSFADLSKGDFEDFDGSRLEEVDKKVYSYIASLGVTWDLENETVTVKDDEALKEVEEMAAGISAADEDDMEWYNRFNLSGDDSIDYNGGFILELVDAIRALQHKTKSKGEIKAEENVAYEGPTGSPSRYESKSELIDQLVDSLIKE